MPFLFRISVYVLSLYFPEIISLNRDFLVGPSHSYFKGFFCPGMVWELPRENLYLLGSKSYVGTLESMVWAFSPKKEDIPANLLLFYALMSKTPRRSNLLSENIPPYGLRGSLAYFFASDVVNVLSLIGSSFSGT